MTMAQVKASRWKHKLDPKVPRVNARAGMVRRTKK